MPKRGALSSHGASLNRSFALRVAAGQSFDLSGVGYGRRHSGDTGEISTKPMTYYPFLAGVAAHIGATATIEIGTHWGGSAVAGCCLGSRHRYW